MVQVARLLSSAVLAACGLLLARDQVFSMEPAAIERHATSRVYVMTVLVAGLRHHDAKQVWEALAIGDPLELVREPANEEDRNAVRIEWCGFHLGYLPKERNSDIARQLDRGAPLLARITQIAKYRNHRKKLQLEIFVEF